MKKKLLLISPMLHQGGFERVCVATARLLAEDYDVTIAIFSDEDIAYDINGLNVMNLNIPAVEGKLGKLVNVARRALRVSALRRKMKPAAVYSFGTTANLVNILSRSAGTTVCSVRSYMDLLNPRMMKLYLDRSDVMICCSKTIEQELREKYGAKHACTLYNPFDRDLILAKGADKDPDMAFDASVDRVIVSMGRQDDVKGFWHLVKSFSLVHEKHPDTRLLIVGEGDFSEYYKLAEDLGVRDAVNFPGVKKNPFCYLAGACMYVLPSINEGFPNVLVEAMTLGIPVIASNCKTGPAEILSKTPEAILDRQEYMDADHGLLIPTPDPVKNLDASLITEEEHALAEQMLRLLEDQDLAERMGKASAERAADFSQESYRKTLLSYLS